MVRRSSGPSETVLGVVDRTVLVTIPILLASLLLWTPLAPRSWWAMGGASAMASVAVSVLGRSGRAPWRGTVYALLTLVTASMALWVVGPITGVGVMFGLAVLLGGSLLSAPMLAVVMGIAIIAIAGRAIVGGPSGAFAPDVMQARVSTTLWLGTALASGALLWMAMRLLTVLFGSLERSHAQALGAYREEIERHEQLDAARQQLDELAQVELVGRLAGGVAHDVNNALAAILATADVLATEVETPDQRRHLAELEAASHHAADLVRDLLWTGRRFPPSSTAEADLEAVTRACAERVVRVCRTVQLQVMVHHVAHVAMSPEHLEQTLFTLVTGADRAGVDKLVLEASLIGGEVVITLVELARDTARAERPRSMQDQLNVAAARDLFGQYGGTLEMGEESQPMRVTLRIPLAASQRDAAPVPAPTRRTALVVEDEPMVLRRLCQLVARRGYEVRGASTVAEGMAALASQQPDLLITDLQLPDGSGEEVALASFRQDPTRPIIVCSGFSRDDVLQGPLRNALLTFLAKPFTTADLNAALVNQRVSPTPRMTGKFPRVGVAPR